MDRPYDVFVSYSRFDAAFAQPLAQFIARNSVNFAGGPWHVFLDTSELHGGQDWFNRIMAAIGSCHTCVAVLSPHYLDSRMCMKEWGVMQTRVINERADRLFPLLRSACDLTPDMRAVSYHDLSRHEPGSDGFEQSAHQLVEDLARVINTTPADVQPAPTESPMRISESVRVVYHNAERTMEHMRLIADRVSGLVAHNRKLAGVLDFVTEIADRSDRLSLNASLEGTRAGEAGRGFTLVAAEMRRLTENVTDSIKDIKRLVADGRGIAEAILLATEEGINLGAETSESAKQFTFIAHHEQAATEQVGGSLDEVLDLLLNRTTNSMSCQSDCGTSLRRYAWTEQAPRTQTMTEAGQRDRPRGAGITLIKWPRIATHASRGQAVVNATLPTRCCR